MTSYYEKFIPAYEELAGNGNRRRYQINHNFIIDVTKCTHDLNNPRDLINLCKKHGYISKTIPTHISINTYFTDSNGDCWGYYNITIARDKINFEYLREWSEDNIKELLCECIRLYETDIRIR